jgi:hypothetical protein
VVAVNIVNATAYPSGVNAVSSVGSPTVIANVSVSVSGVVAHSSVGEVTTYASANVYVVGVEALSAVGRPFKAILAITVNPITIQSPSKTIDVNSQLKSVDSNSVKYVINTDDILITA